MSKADDIRAATHQVEAERFQCITCSGVAQEHSDYCVSCEVYWDDVRLGHLDQGDETCRE